MMFLGLRKLGNICFSGPLGLEYLQGGQQEFFIIVFCQYSLSDIDKFILALFIV